MTSLAHRDHPARVRAGARRRVTGLARTETLLLRRFGVIAATAAVTALWVAIVLAVPAATRQVIAPLALLVDVTALGFLFVPALLVLERVEGVEPAMRLTPVRTVERVGVRVGFTTALSLGAGLAITVAARVPHIAVALSGVATASVLVSLIAFVAVGSSATLTTFLVRAPLFAAPLVTPALIAAAGLAESPLLRLSPLTSAFDMMRGQMSWMGLAWQIAWVLAAALLVGRVARRPLPGEAPAATHRATTWLTHPGGYSRMGVVRSFMRADRRAVVRDGVLIMLAGSVPLVAVAGRVVSTVGVGWARGRYGIDPTAYLPVVWVILLVAHTPVMFGALTGLLLLEERDAGLLPAIATTRASLDALLRYRLLASAVCTAAALALAFGVAGVRHPAGVVGLAAVTVAAAALSTVPAMLMAAFARNRVQAMAVMKVLGLPLYLPVASWFIVAPARWLFAPLPSSWAMWTMWAVTPGAALAFAAVGTVVCVATTAALSRRFRQRATQR